MTQEQIIEGNKLISEFMGLKIGNAWQVWNGYADYSQEAEFEYHQSWNWLMPVVERINETRIPENDFPASVIIFKTTCHINDDQQIIVEADIKKGEDLLICVWKAVVEFIKWYKKGGQT